MERVAGGVRSWLVTVQLDFLPATLNGRLEQWIAALLLSRLHVHSSRTVDMPDNQLKK